MKKVSPENYNEKAAKAHFDKALNNAPEASRKPMMTAIFCFAFARSISSTRPTREKTSELRPTKPLHAAMNCSASSYAAAPPTPTEL